MSEFDYVFVCTRAEQREEALAVFETLDCSEKGAIITFPAWRQTLEPWKRFGSCHYMFPGVVALYRGDDVAYTLNKTKIAPLFDTLVEESEALSAAMAEAGLPSEMDLHLVRWFQTVMAMGFPVLAAISTHDYNPELFARDDAMVRLAARGAKEGMAALRATGEPVSGFAYAAHIAPQFMLRFGIRRAVSTLSGFTREMLEVHFAKIHDQTILLLRELVSLPDADTMRHPAIDELLRRTA